MDDVPLRPRPGSEKEPRVHSSPPRSVASTTYLEPPPPTPGYGASALLLQPSPLMTSDLHPRNSATTTQESIYLRRAKFLRWSRLVLTVLVVCTALATVGCAGHVLDKYNSTQAKFHLPPLWPINVDLRPTLAVMISACLMMALSVTYLAVSFIPTPHSRTVFYNILFFGTSAGGLILTAFALGFANTLTGFNSHHQRESIQSWTCKFSDGASQFTANAQSLNIPVYVSSGMPIPAGFKQLCEESKAGQGLVAALFALEAVSCVLAIVGLALERDITKKRNQRYAVKDEKVMSMF